MAGFPGDVPLVGREQELSQLRDAVTGAIAGSPGAVLVSGEAGVGKTSAHQFARLLKSVDVKAVDDSLGRQGGVLLGQARLSDAVDASVMAAAATGDRILTSDSDDIALSWPCPDDRFWS